MTEETSQPVVTPQVPPAGPTTPKSTTSDDSAELNSSTNNNNGNHNYAPRQQGNNRNRQYNNGQRQPYQKNYNNNYSKNSSTSNSTGYSRYNKNRSNNYNNTVNTSSNSGNNSKNNSFNNTNRYNNGSRFNNSQYYTNSANVSGTEESMTQASQQQQQPNVAWPGYYVPQMYYIPQQMATAAAMASANGMPVDMANTSMSPPMTSPQLGMASLNSTVPLMPVQSPPVMTPNNMSGPNSNNNTTSNLTSPILSHITPVLSPPKKKIEITTKSGEKLDLSQIHNNKLSSPTLNTSTASPQKIKPISLNTTNEVGTTKANVETTSDTTQQVEETEAEKNRKAFLEQVRLRKLAMDKKKQLKSDVTVEVKSEV